MVINSSQQTDLESRFCHLLQPIRDLTRNWNVDIATQLEDYLEEIESISITFDGGKTTLNFAEAALLIQGSACIYSKKVEYLHSLVYQVLDLMASKKKLQQAASVDAEGRDKDATYANKHQDDDEFLMLDDIKIPKSNELKEDANDKTMNVLPRVTLALLPLEEGEKGDNPLISRGGEILGSRNDFKMNTSNIHPSGVLLLDLSHLDLLELSMQNKPSSTPFVPRTAKLTDMGDAPPFAEDLQVDEGLPQDISMEDNGDCIDLPLEGAPEAEIEDPIPDEIVQDKMGPRRSERNKNMIGRPPNKPMVDPWLPLEPHIGNTTEKLFRKKKTYQISASLQPETTKKRKRKVLISIGEKRLESISDFITKAFYSRHAHFPKNPLKVPSLPEFEHLYWEEYKMRQAKLKKERKKMEELGRHQDLAEEIEEEAEEDNCAEAPPDMDDDDDCRVDFHIPEVTDLGPLQPEFADDQHVGMMQEEALDYAPIVSSYEELVRYHVEGFLASAQQYAQITELSRRVTEWEEKIMPKLQEEVDHGPFDIHKYGSDVLKQLSSKDPAENNSVQTDRQIPFRKICHNKQPYEVCRLLLATLQLANNNNLEIESEGTLDEAIDTMSVRLMSTRQHFQELQEYRAPSIDH